MAYTVYQIWLSRNSLIFEVEVVLVQRVVERARCLAKEYCRFDTATMSSWDSFTVLAAARRTLHFLGAPTLRIYQGQL